MIETRISYRCFDVGRFRIHLFPKPGESSWCYTKDEFFGCYCHWLCLGRFLGIGWWSRAS